MRTTKLNYLRIIQQQYRSGVITKKEYKRELKFTKTINDYEKTTIINYHNYGFNIL